MYLIEIVRRVAARILGQVCSQGRATSSRGTSGRLDYSSKPISRRCWRGLRATRRRQRMPTLKNGLGCSTEPYCVEKALVGLQLRRKKAWAEPDRTLSGAWLGVKYFIERLSRQKPWTAQKKDA